ncbi:MAG: 50S ribosomal protein L6 [Wolbachia endosymbiont of Menacanthus eurysternus]|nr:MAG: 50S ribosomal protein L6 [Wolbachia endosymbiont of Menacanthus eurysternus]
MSRIGAAPINIPVGISVECSDNGNVLIKNDKVEKRIRLCSGIICNIVNNQLLLSVDQNKVNLSKVKSIWGAYRSNIKNIINGMINNFSVDLEVSGIGYKAECNDKYLTLYLGYSHNVKYKIPRDIEIKCIKPTQLIVSSMDKQKAYMIASDICRIRKYDPYKGKGITIKGRFILRKVVTKKK